MARSMVSQGTQDIKTTTTTEPPQTPGVTSTTGVLVLGLREQGPIAAGLSPILSTFQGQGASAVCTRVLLGWDGAPSLGWCLGQGQTHRAIDQ